MKIVLITFITPASENIRGTSALPYHLMVERGKDVDIYIYSFNANKLSDDQKSEVEKELNVNIKQLPLPKWYVWLFKFHLLFLRVFMKYPIGNYIKLPYKFVDEINDQKPDLIWVYGEELSRVVKQFPELRRIQIGPDTESLYYYRMMGQRFVMKDLLNYWKCALMYHKYARMERKFCTDRDFTYYAVGEEDVKHLQQLNPKVNAKFLRHPHYDIKEKVEEREGYVGASLARNGEKRKFHQPKIKLLIAGRYDLYMRQSADELFDEFMNLKKEELKSCYSFTFLGKGWEKHVEILKKLGYEVNHITFAPNYMEEICKHDIQITPISIGTGTKGKVLDALANGLLVIGTPYALENIVVKHGESCIEYRHPNEVIETLQDILKQKEKYEQIAEMGREHVLKYHNRAELSMEVFGKLNS